VEGDESTTNSSLEEEFVPTQDEGLNEQQQDGPRERPQRQRKGLVIGGLPPKRWNGPPSLFPKNLKLCKRR
jgi:hypothetical protein